MQRYDRCPRGYAGGIERSPGPGKWVGQGTANPVWRAYCGCPAGRSFWVWYETEAVELSEKHRQTGERFSFHAKYH
jgi:hypothetical protein